MVNDGGYTRGGSFTWGGGGGREGVRVNESYLLEVLYGLSNYN